MIQSKYIDILTCQFTLGLGSGFSRPVKFLETTDTKIADTRFVNILWYQVLLKNIGFTADGLFLILGDTNTPITEIA
jgi:hypothetical protein